MLSRALIFGYMFEDFIFSVSTDVGDIIKTVVYICNATVMPLYNISSELSKWKLDVLKGSPGESKDRVSRGETKGNMILQKFARRSYLLRGKREKGGGEEGRGRARGRDRAN